MKKIIFLNGKYNYTKEALDRLCDFLGNDYCVIVVEGLEKTLEVFEI